MPIQQKLPPPVLLFSDFSGWVGSLVPSPYKVMTIILETGQSLLQDAGTLNIVFSQSSVTHSKDKNQMKTSLLKRDSAVKWFDHAVRVGGDGDPKYFLQIGTIRDEFFSFPLRTKIDVRLKYRKNERIHRGKHRLSSIHLNRYNCREGVEDCIFDYI